MHFKSRFIVFFTVCTLASPAFAAGSFSPQPILRNYLLASQMLERCPHIAADRSLTVRKRQVDAFGQFLIDSLAMRASNITPGLSRGAAAGQILQWMNRQARAVPNNKLCNMATVGQLRDVFNSFAKPSVQEALRRYAARRDVGIRPERLRANMALETYALPQFQQLALEKIASTHTKGVCRIPQVNRISVVRKKKQDTRNRPVFVEPTLQFVERWDFHCGGHIGHVELTFSRDNDKMVGTYTIADR